MSKIDKWRKAGFTQDEIDAHVAKKRSQWSGAGFSEDEINTELGIAKYNPEPMNQVMQTYLSKDEPDSFWDKFLKSFEPSWAERRARSYKALVGAENANLSPSKFEPTMIDAITQGYEQSVTGLIQRGTTPDNRIPAAAMKYLPTSQRLAMQTATVAGDLPFMVAGGIIGGASGGPLTAMGGAFALPAGLRKVYTDMYEKGEIQSVAEFWQRMGDAVMETLKGEATGIATAAAGASIPGAVGFAAEIGAMTTMGAAMEGTIPEPQDFLDAAILVGGMKASSAVSARLSGNYARKGEHPYSIVERMKSEPKLQEEYVSSNFKDGKKAPKAEKEPVKEAVEDKGKPKTAQEQVLDTISVGEGKAKKTLKETLHDLYTMGVDDMHPLGEVVKQINQGEKVEVAKDPYKLARLFRGAKGLADHFLEKSPFTFNGKQDVGKPLSKILDPFKNDLNGIRAYMKSKRALELNRRGIESGVPTDAAKEVVKSGKAQYEQAFKELKEYQDHTLKYLRDSGLMDTKTYKQIKELNKDYAPFYRVKDASQKGSGKGLEAYDPIKAIKGSELKTVDPLESIIKNTYLFTTLAEKNRIGSSLVELAGKKDGMGLYVKRVKRPMKPIRVSKEELNRAVDKYTTIIESVTKKTKETTTNGSSTSAEKAISKVEDRVLEALQSRGWSEGESAQIVSRLKESKSTTETKTIIKETVEKDSQRLDIDIPDEGMTIFRPGAFHPKENQIKVWIKGKEQMFEVHPEIARVFKSLDAESMSMFVKIMSIPAKWLRAGAILTPEFIARNPLRDTLSAFVYSKWGFAPVVDLMHGVSSTLKKDSYYREWQKSGGMMSELTALDRKYLQKGLGEVVAKYPVLNRIKYGANPLEMLRVLSELSEQGTRVGAFRKARKKGAGLEEAGYESREITLDFARIGAKTRAVNSMIAFWNANVQGTDKLVRSFKDNPVATTAKVAAGITVPSMLLAAVNSTDGRWDDIPRWQKDLFWIVMPNHVSKEEWSAMSAKEQATFSEDNHIWRIPKPFELGIIFGTVPERFVEARLEDDPEVLEGFLSSIGRGATPGLLPTAAIGPIENWANKSFFLDRPLIPSQMEGILPEYQYKNYTTEAAKGLGKLLGKLPPIKENPNISPIKIENLIRSWSGGLGLHALKLASWGMEKAGLVEPEEKPEATFSDWPVIKAFHVRYPSAGTEGVNKFYESYFSSKKYMRTFDYLVKQKFDGNEAMNLIAGKEAKMVELDGIYKSISTAHSTLQAIHNNPTMKADEKRQLIDVVYFTMIKMAKAGNKVTKEIKTILDEKGE